MDVDLRPSDADGWPSGGTERTEDEAHLEGVLAALGEGVLVQDALGRVRSANERILALLGLTEYEVLGQKSGELRAQLFEPSGEPLVAERRPGFRALRSGQPVVDQLVRCSRPGLDDMWVELSCYPLRRPGVDEPYGIATSIRDVTTRHLVEERNRFQARLLDSVGQAVISTDDARRITYWNEAAARIFGWSADEVLGRSIDEAMIDVGQGELLLAAWATLGQTGGWTGEIVAKRKDGSRFPVDLTLAAVAGGAGEQAGTICVATDITDRKALEQTVLADRKSLAEAQRIGHLGSFERDFVTGSRRWSEELYRMMGVAPGTPIVDNLYVSLIHPDDREHVESVFSAAEHAGEDGEVEHRIVRPDGSVRWVHARHLVSADGTRVHGTVLDVTDRVRAEEAERSRREALEASNLKTAFVSRMSHELRTPLNAILGFGQLLELDELSPDQRDNVDNILRAGEHLLGLIGEILDISTIERGAMRLSMEPVAVGDIVDEVAGMLRPLADRRSVHIIVDPRGLGVCVFADRQRFKQVILNLLANAVKYNRDGGEVRIRGEALDGVVRVTFWDTGVGIGQEEMDRLFQPFERLWAGQSHVEGAGLGLALSRQLANAMEGDIGVASRIGEGSSFWVELPLTDAPAIDHEMGRPNAAANVASAPGPSTILYVEDNPLNVRLIERVMARRPEVTLMVAMEGQLALELATEQQPDLILLDLHLPDISGEEVLRRLRADPRTEDTPVVVLSADAASTRPAQLRSMGANDYMTKPLDIARLLAIVDEIEAAPRDPQTTPRRGPTTIRDAGSEIDTQPVEAPTVAAMTASEFVHDIHNLLGVILNYCTLLGRDLSDPGSEADLREIQTAAEDAVGLVREMFLRERSGSRPD